MKVFVDTVAWIAWNNPQDALHSRTRHVMGNLRKQNTQFVTTEFILLEVADALATQKLRSQTVVFLNKLRQQPDLQIISAGSGLLTAGWTLYQQRLDKEWGLTDCTSFVVMTRARITQAVTSDRHFQQAGFVPLL